MYLYLGSLDNKCRSQEVGVFARSPQLVQSNRPLLLMIFLATDCQPAENKILCVRATFLAGCSIRSSGLALLLNFLFTLFVASSSGYAISYSS